MTLHTRARALGPGALDRLSSIASRFALPFRRRKSLARLQELNDHLLKDIGLTRLDVREMHRRW